MRNSHRVPACHRSLDLLFPPAPLALPLSFPLFILLFPLRGVVCRLTSGSLRPLTSDPDHLTHVTLVTDDDTMVSMETGYVTHVSNDLGVRVGRSESIDLEDDLERRRLEMRGSTDLAILDLGIGDPENFDLELRPREKHAPSADHLEERDLRRHDLEKNDDLNERDLEPRHLTHNDGPHIEHLNLDLDPDLDHDHDLDLENSSRSPEASPTDDYVTFAAIRHAFRRPFNSLKLPVPPDVINPTRRRHQNVTRYRLVFQSRSSSSSSGGSDVTPGSGSVNLMIIPLGAIFVFIVIWVLHVSRWCIEDIRLADGMLAKRHLGPGFISSGAPPRPLAVGRSSLPAIERIAIGTARACAAANSETDLARLHTRARIQRQTRIVPARSTRSLNGGTRDHRNCDRANRKQGSDSSIPMTEMTSSTVRCLRHAEQRGRLAAPGVGDGGIVESCKRAVGSFLQSHLIVVPVDRNAPGFTGSGSDTRTRNFSSPASSSKTGSSCSESRPLLARCSSSSDGRMTSSDSNIDVMSPLAVRRRLAGETRYRTKPSCVNSAGNLLANRIVAVQHGRLHPVAVGGRPVGYGHQSSAPAVSKLVHESLNLSFRFFQVPLCSGSSSAKDSLDSVFVCGIYADDVTPTVATPTSGVESTALRQPEVDGETTTSHRPRPHQPRQSKERTPVYSLFDRQSSIGEEEAAKLGHESSMTLHEGPEMDCVRFEGRLGVGARPEVTQRTNGGCHGNRADGFRRTRSANELQVLSARDKRSRKCLTA